MGAVRKIMVQYLCITLVTPRSDDSVWAAHSLKSPYKFVSPGAEEFRIVVYTINIVRAAAVGHASYVVENGTWLFDFIFDFLQYKHYTDVRFS